MDKFWELLSESVIVQGILTLGMSAFICVLLYQKIEVPRELWTLLGLSWGFYFGSKSQQAITVMTRK
jgi:intracellular septation protein A